MVSERIHLCRFLLIFPSRLKKSRPRYSSGLDLADSQGIHLAHFPGGFESRWQIIAAEILVGVVGRSGNPHSSFSRRNSATFKETRMGSSLANRLCGVGANPVSSFPRKIATAFKDSRGLGLRWGRIGGFLTHLLCPFPRLVFATFKENAVGILFGIRLGGSVTKPHCPSRGIFRMC